ncbi:putative tetraspanin [Ixodes scapularis]|uniref:Tetraspanin n=1 Tax=Ixodes scapularis TaxID=6945 RepID=B7Q3S5_IXOSC|nr:tetraspanin, putative [Ixodes scapularis]|eukprot:XP_002411373.1 tetraspanin, putative [Ixodes scapularis]
MGSTVLRYCLFFSSLAVWLFGVALLVLGGLLAADLNVRQVREFFDVFDNYGAASILTLVVGSCLFCIGFLGCCGSFFKDSLLLIPYNVLMLLFIILELTVMGLVWKHANGEQLENNLSEAFVKLIVKSKSGLAEVERFVDNIQYRLQCCGGLGPKDYEALEMPPTTSCKYYDSNEEQAAAYQQGCGRAIRNFLMSKSLAIGLVCLIVLLIEVFSVASAIYLLVEKKKKNRPKVTPV